MWFTTKYEIADGCGLFACSDINRHNCPNLQKAELAIAQRDNDTGGYVAVEMIWRGALELGLERRI